jgi:hypothetical protein
METQELYNKGQNQQQQNRPDIQVAEIRIKEKYVEYNINKTLRGNITTEDLGAIIT